MDKVWLLMGLATIGVLAYMLYPFTGILVSSIFVYYMTRPLYDRILPKVKSKSVTAIASILILALPVILMVMYTLGVASLEMNRAIENTELQSLYTSRVFNETVGIAGNLKHEEMMDILLGKKDISGGILEIAYSTSSILWGVVSSAFDILFGLFLVFVITFYLLVDGGEIRNWLKATVFRKEGLADRFFDELDYDLSNVFHGNILTAGVIAVIAAVLFTLMDYFSSVISIPYPVLLGILCGIASLIPIAGEALVWGPLTLYLALDAHLKGVLEESLVSIVFFCIATYFIADWLPNMLLRPRMTGHRLHKGLMLLSYIFGPIVFGLKGLFLGPMILVFAINFGEVVMPELTKK